ncbi:MAG TPA: hypothetical protein VFI31_19750, partial [Pirellulales bacterium]|nr:hypothetical protein [Pirellulales bacterium]
TWGQLKSLLTAHAGRPTLMWLPATGIWDDGEPANPHAGKAAKLGCGWSEVRWNTGGQGGGCVLIYSSIHVSALRSAVDEIARIAEWGNSRFLAVRHSRVPA